MRADVAAALYGSPTRRLPPATPGDADNAMASSRTRKDAEHARSIGTPHGLPFTRLGDLLAEPTEDIRWVVEDRLPSGGLSLVAGKPKAGKSTLARCLALAVARGEPWLGCPTVGGPVFYLALEEKRAEVRAHFTAMGATDEDVRLFFGQAPEDGLRLLREAAERERPALIIIDPLLRFVRLRDANDYAEVTRALEPLLMLARDTGAHVLGVHHAGKGDRSGGDAILGSTAIFAAVDTALLLKRSEKYRTLSSIQRYGEELEETTLTLDPESRTITAGPSRRDAEEGEAATAILDYLRLQTELLEESTIHDAVEGRKVVKERALRRLCTQGMVTRTGKGRRGDPYLYAPARPDSAFLPPTTTREGPEGESKIAPIAATVALDTPSRVAVAEGLGVRSREGVSEGSGRENPGSSRETEWRP